MKNNSLNVLFKIIILILLISYTIQNEEKVDPDSETSPLRMPYRFGKREGNLWKSKITDITDQQRENLKRALKRLKKKSRNAENFDNIGVFQYAYTPKQLNNFDYI
jgi:hypothetical protein